MSLDRKLKMFAVVFWTLMVLLMGEAMYATTHLIMWRLCSQSVTAEVVFYESALLLGIYFMVEGMTFLQLRLTRNSASSKKKR